MENRKFGSLSSSEDPEKLAATVKAAILALASLIIMFGNYLGVQITQDEMVQVATQLSLAVSSVWFVWGLLRKVVVHFTKRSV